MAKIYITYELLALFIEGKTTPEESAVILAAARENEEIRNIIKEALDDGSFWASVSGVSENAAAIPVSKLQLVKSKNLPVMRLAACSEANDCVVKCEQFAKMFFGKEVNKTERHEWKKDAGIPLYNIGRSLEKERLSVSRQFGGTLEAIQNEIDGGATVIVALNAKRLANPKARSCEPDHAVVVVEVNTKENYIEIFDPQSPEPTDKYPVDVFLRSWKCAKNYFVSIVERGVRPYTPHPEYVGHIKLSENLTAIADMLAENAHETWAKDRMDEYIRAGKDPYKDPSMKPYSELTKAQRKLNYLPSVNTLKLLCKLGFRVEREECSNMEFKTNKRNENGIYIPKPLCVDAVKLPDTLTDLTEYIAENAHEEWAKARIKEGFVYAPENDKDNKKNKDLIPYCELIDSEKEYDRKMAMNTLKVLYKMGYKIEK